ncbi:hypothetical protein D7Z26_10665 [Cohnella endophytica]|uniref:Uncharacterized protein n=1 Tax=Cohnella endophytica TaxID=2419778 RepID=A0A494Y0G7_9BACL|nr:hypothetical protein [Cohnella endophytica]RKP53852.1 hypothetical protein D7Z26_10665 [Cohnella endophytica]
MAKKRKRSRRRRGIWGLRKLRKLDPVLTGLASLIVVLLIAWGGLYWKESANRSFIAYATGEKRMPDRLSERATSQVSASESIPESAAESGGRYETQSGIPAYGEEVDPPGESGKSGEPSSEENYQTPSADEGSVSRPNADNEPGQQPETPFNGNIADSNQKPESADDELPDSVVVGTPLSSERKYEQEMAKAQATCADRMKEAEKGAEEGMKQTDRNNPYAVKAWSDQWTKELSAAESACDASFEQLSDQAIGESVSEQKIEEWKQAYEERKKELQTEAQATVQRLLGG